MKRFSLTVIAVLTAWCAVQLAAPAPAGANAEKEARALRKEGMKQLRQGNHPGALGALEESHRLVPKTELLYHIGVCQQEMMLYVEAITSYQRFLDEGGGDGNRAKRKLGDKAMGAIAELSAQIGYIQIVDAPEGAEILLDGMPVGQAPITDSIPADPGLHLLDANMPGYEPYTADVEVPAGGEVVLSVLMLEAGADLELQCTDPDAKVLLDGEEIGGCPFLGVIMPGSHTIVVESPGKQTFTKEVTVVAGDQIVLTATLLPVAGGPSLQDQLDAWDDDDGDAGPVLKVIGGVATGLGGAGLVTGLVFTAKGSADYSDAQDAAKSYNETFEPKDEETYNDIKNNKLPMDRVGMIAGLAGGGALLITGIVLLVVAGSDDEDGDWSLAPTAGGLEVTF